MIAYLLLAAAALSGFVDEPDVTRLERQNADLRKQVQENEKLLSEVHAKQEKNQPAVEKVKQLEAKVDAPPAPWYEKWESYIIALLSGGGARGLQLLNRAKRAGWLMYCKIQALECAIETLAPATRSVALQLDALSDAAEMAAQKPYDVEKIARAFDMGALALNKIKGEYDVIEKSIRSIADAGKW